jgi:hypothetical protein
MCTLVLLRRPGHRWPIIVAANRDEMVDRPALPPARHWPDRPEVVAGQDMLAGGSWFGINDFGVVAGILNRTGSLGPDAVRRSRGELALEALDHADAAAAAEALAAIDPAAYRTFNLVIADNRDAYWLRHADPTGVLPVTAAAIGPGLHMIAAGDLDDTETPRLALYRPRFLAAPAPDPDLGDWTAWQALLDDRGGTPEDGPLAALNFTTARGFATVSSALVALPSFEQGDLHPIFRFRVQRPVASPWRDILG